MTERNAARGGPRRYSRAVTIVVTAVTVAIATQAVAAIGAIPSDGRFTACYQTSDNVLNRVVLFAEAGEQCPPTCARVTWPAQASGGATGPPGPTGPQGPPGPQGPGGSAGGFGQVRVASRTVELRAASQRATARCLLGETALSGGFKVHWFASATEFALGSYPLVNKGGRPVGWAFAPRRVRSVENAVSPLQLSKAFYITRASPRPGLVHNHEFFYRGGYLSDLALAGPREPLDAFPLKVDVYAICARR